MPSVPILMYHQVDPAPLPGLRKYTVTPAELSAQLSWLRRHGYTSIDPKALHDARSGAARLPPRPVLITFDDGYAAAVEHAPDLLEAAGYHATFFAVAGMLGERASWLAPEIGAPPALAAPAALVDLDARGFGVAAHSMTHPRLSELSEEACWWELAEARTLLEGLIRRPVLDLAYPFGSYDARVRALAARAGYRTACSVRIGVSRRDDDPLALHRVPIDGRESLWDFACRARSGWSCRERVGRAIRFRWRSRA